MSRIVIELPEKFLFSTEYRVPAEFVNNGNHLGADHVLSIAVKAQAKFVADLGYSSGMDIEGLGLIMADSAIIYKSESDLDDLLKIDVFVANLANKSFEVIYRMTNVTKNCEAARVKTSILFFDYTAKKPAAIPAAFRAQVGG